MDDATSKIYSAFFVGEEGTMSSFQALSEVIGAEGLFCSLYVDRGSHDWHTPEAGGKMDKDNPTQVGRALQQLGIELIAVYSPEARGRSERMFGTLQKHLPQELRLAGITDMVEANPHFLKEVYLPLHNARFAVTPEGEDSAFVPFTGARWNANSRWPNTKPRSRPAATSWWIPRSGMSRGSWRRGGTPRLSASSKSSNASSGWTPSGHRVPRSIVRHDGTGEGSSRGLERSDDERGDEAASDPHPDRGSGDRPRREGQRSGPDDSLGGRTP